MAKRQAKIDPPGSRQLSLFDLIAERHAEVRATDRPLAGSCNVAQPLREAITEGLKRSPFSRYEIAGRMSELTGIEITKSMLDSWTAESKEGHRFPAEYLPAYCRATGYIEILRIIAEPVDCYVLESESALLAELGQISQQREALKRKEQAIKRFLAEMKRGENR